jgi:hypothetical protein
MSVVIQNNSGLPIRSFADWEDRALPEARRKKHWQPGRSACELGRVWTVAGTPSVPDQLVQLLEATEGTRGITISKGITEHETQLPPGNAGPRCHDLFLYGDQNTRPVVISIEAKADESFGDTLTKALAKSREEAKKRNGTTKFPDRLDWLTRSLFGLAAFSDGRQEILAQSIAALHYQLFSAIGGTLLEADREGASKAIFIIHEFRTSKTKDAKLSANAQALNQFLELFLSSNGQGPEPDFKFENGRMVGPILLPERSCIHEAKIPHSIPLFIGKIRTDLRGDF